MSLENARFSIKMLNLVTLPLGQLPTVPTLQDMSPMRYKTTCQFCLLHIDVAIINKLPFTPFTFDEFHDGVTRKINIFLESSRSTVSSSSTELKTGHCYSPKFPNPPVWS